MENDRTWCFWEDSAGLFETIVHRRWSKLWFHGKAEPFSRLHDIDPYQYKMIRGVDFYNYCFDIIALIATLLLSMEQADYFTSDDERASLTINERVVTADIYFSSIRPYDVTAAKHDIIFCGSILRVGSFRRTRMGLRRTKRHLWIFVLIRKMTHDLYM